MSHTTHFDDCGCLTARYEARIATLEAELAASREDARAGWTEQAEMSLECYALLATANDLRAALEKLACLGNGDLPGNSEGNVIAQRALAANAVPAASLAAHDAEVLERAARAVVEGRSCKARHPFQPGECEECHWFDGAANSARSALAAQAATHSVPDGTSEVKP